MGSERLMALTDGVVAVVITIMVLELKPPHGADLASLAELLPTFLSFALLRLRRHLLDQPPPFLQAGST